MNIFYIVSCAILIATANAKPSTAGPNSDDDPFGYYDGPMDDSPPPDQNEDDVTTILRPKFLMQPETIVVKEGENATLRCPVENGKYFGAMWRKDEEVIAQGTISTKSDLYAILPNNTLLVKHVKPSSAGYYSCVIAISSSNNITLTHKLKLENAAEIVSLRVQNNVTQLHTGDTLILTCEVDGKPMPTIKWYFDSSDGAREISYGNHQSTGYKDTLTITDVSFKNNGTYRCFADNKISADHQSIVIEVFVAPIIRIEKIYSKSKILLGFNCLITANPIASIFWKRNGKIIDSNHILRRTENSLKIIFNNVDESDLGKYTCIAKNFNTTETDVMFLKPLQPQFRGFSSLGSNKGEVLTWTIVSPDPLKHCVVYYKGENETRQSIATSDIMKFENGYLIAYTPSVPHDGTYKFRLKCLSEAGWSDESQERSLGVTDKGRDTATSDSQISGGLRLLPSLLLVAVTAVIMNP